MRRRYSAPGDASNSPDFQTVDRSIEIQVSTGVEWKQSCDGFPIYKNEPEKYAEGTIPTAADLGPCRVSPMFRDSRASPMRLSGSRPVRSALLACP